MRRTLHNTVVLVYINMLGFCYSVHVVCAQAWHEMSALKGNLCEGKQWHTAHDVPITFREQLCISLLFTCAVSTTSFWHAISFSSSPSPPRSLHLPTVLSSSSSTPVSRSRKLNSQSSKARTAASITSFSCDEDKNVKTWMCLMRLQWLFWPTKIQLILENISPCRYRRNFCDTGIKNGLIDGCSPT